MTSLFQSTLSRTLSTRDRPRIISPAVCRSTRAPWSGRTRILWPNDFWPSEKTNQASAGIAEQVKAREHETTADRNLRWYNGFNSRRGSRSYGTYEAIFDAMSRDEFGHNGKAATIKKAVNSIRGPKGETNRR